MSNENQESYLRCVHSLQEIAKELPYVTHQDVLDVASMSREELQRRALIARDWHSHFAHALDGIKEIRCIPGSGIDGCRGDREVRAVVTALVDACPVTWERTFRGEPKSRDLNFGRPADPARVEP